MFEGLNLPENEWQCCHVDTTYVQNEGAAKGMTHPEYNRCTNRLLEINGVEAGFLCSYHDRLVLTKRITINQLKVIVEALTLAQFDTIPQGIIETDAREIAKFPVKRSNSLRTHECPTVPTLKGSDGTDRVIFVNPEWEKVSLNA